MSYNWSFKSNILKFCAQVYKQKNTSLCRCATMHAWVYVDAFLGTWHMYTELYGPFLRLLTWKISIIIWWLTIWCARSFEVIILKFSTFQEYALRRWFVINWFPIFVHWMGSELLHCEWHAGKIKCVGYINNWIPAIFCLLSLKLFTPSMNREEFHGFFCSYF